MTKIRVFVRCANGIIDSTLAWRRRLPPGATLPGEGVAWYCQQSSDPAFRSCTVPEESAEQDEWINEVGVVHDLSFAHSLRGGGRVNTHILSASIPAVQVAHSSFDPWFERRLRGFKIVAYQVIKENG